MAAGQGAGGNWDGKTGQETGDRKAWPASRPAMGKDEVTRMRAGKNCVSLIKKYEGCRLEAYRDPVGVLTIGYGHTGGVREGQVITQAEAEAYLRNDLERSEGLVMKYDGRYRWTQNEMDALVSFCYNIGNIDQLTAKGTRGRQEIAGKMPEYDRVGGKHHKLLRARREEERALFLTPCAAAGGTGGQAGIVEYSLRKDGGSRVSRDFRVSEFRCRDGSDRILVDAGFVRDKLQAIRDHFNAPVTVNSAYRTAAYNASLPDAAKKSYHLTGQAFDIVVKGHTPLEVARHAQKLGISGIIQYNTFVHVDSRAGRYWARNDNGKVTVKSSF